MQPKKSLGQNFLRSKVVVDGIVSASFLKPNDICLEIGPGEGFLTEALLNKDVNVIAIEKDDRLIPFLNEKFKNEIKKEKLKIIQGDVLEIDIEKIIGKSKYKLIANIPYYITGQIIRMFLETEKQPSSITLLVQKEVAERVVARDQKESLLSLSVKAYGQPKYVHKVSKGAFYPQPKVDSAVIFIDNISKKNFSNNRDEKEFFELLHASFGHKRKQLLSNLSSKYDKTKLQKIFEELNIGLKVRAEELKIEKWLDLFNKIKTTH